MEARFSAPAQTGPGTHPASCTMGTGFFPEVKSGRVVTLTPQHLLVPWSRKSRATPLLPLWAVRPVQSFSACTVELYLYSPYGPYGLCRASVSVQGCTLPLPLPLQWRQMTTILSVVKTENEGNLINHVKRKNFT